MTLRRWIVGAFAGTLLLSAQDGATTAPAEPGTNMPIVLPTYGELRTYLNLSEPQMNSLEQVQRNKRSAEQEIYQQLQEKERALHGLLQAGSNDALRVGQLTIEINQLRRKLPLSGEPYKTAALAILTEQQRAKLPALAEALRLQAAAWQATYLNLLDNPQPIGLPRPLDAETLSSRPIGFMTR